MLLLLESKKDEESRKKEIRRLYEEEGYPMLFFLKIVQELFNRNAEKTAPKRQSNQFIDPKPAKSFEPFKFEPTQIFLERVSYNTQLELDIQKLEKEQAKLLQDIAELKALELKLKCLKDERNEYEPTPYKKIRKQHDFFGGDDHQVEEQSGDYNLDLGRERSNNSLRSSQLSLRSDFWGGKQAKKLRGNYNLGPDFSNIPRLEPL